MPLVVVPPRAIEYQVQLKPGAGRGGATSKPKAEYKGVKTVLPGGKSIVVAQRGKLCCTKAAFLDQFPDTRPGVYVWAIRAPKTKWTPFYCGMAGSEKGGLRGRMTGYFNASQGICGPIENDSATNRHEYITKQIRQAYDRHCDVKVAYKVTRSGKAKELESKLLAKYDFPCNALENTNIHGSYRPVELQQKLSVLSLFGCMQQRTVLLASKRSSGAFPEAPRRLEP